MGIASLDTMVDSSMEKHIAWLSCAIPAWSKLVNIPITNGRTNVNKFDVTQKCIYCAYKT
jgi:hypothetical protein